MSLVRYSCHDISYISFKSFKLLCSKSLITLVVFYKYESQEYCALETVEEMSVVIFGKDQLQKNWYIISLTRIFVTGVY